MSLKFTTSFKLKTFPLNYDEIVFLSSSYSVVRLSILASQAKDSGSNPDGSTLSLSDLQDIPSTSQFCDRIKLCNVRCKVWQTKLLQTN